MSTLNDLLQYGQSYWLDNLTRKKITSGELKKRVTEQGLRGLTSNPAIFNKAISGSEDYDAQIKEEVAKGASLKDIYDALTVKDIQDACDILRPVFDSSNGTDGFASLEVSPYLGLDTEGSVSEARRLYKLVNRPNCFIKIPGTKEGLDAIEELLYEGININVTLLFSVERYADVAKAYIRALQRRDEEGKPVDKVISVASFFLSRIDVLVNQLLSARIIGGNTDSKVPQTLFGKAGIAAARLAYQRFKKLFSGAEWEKLQAKGAHVQRPLWASTSTKDSLYSDVYYVEALIGPDTVNTLPDETIAAFADHGKLQANTIEQDVHKAQKVFEDLKEMDIDMETIAWQLENDGLSKFVEPFNKLMTGLAQKRMSMLNGKMATQQLNLGDLKKEMETAFTSLDEQQIGKRLYDKDPYLWKNDEQVNMIKTSMGWMTIPDNYEAVVKDLTAFATEIKNEGFKYAVLLGMGGSSLCSEVARETFGTAPGYLKLFVLDNTDPEAIKEIEDQLELEKTLFIVATKSGGTKETLSFYKYFYELLAKKGGDTGKNFVAITDAGTDLVKIAKDKNFRKTFINDSEIGGRYSVLSNFGLLPMALMGIDIDAMLANARQMKQSCAAEVPVAVNPAISLGTVMGMCARKGKDKITFSMSPSLSSFGYWVEQLLAESTGKEGTGLIPVNGEALGTPDVYGNDRLFIHIALASDNNSDAEQKLKAMADAGHPVVHIHLNDKIDLGGEFYRWEIAVAVAGKVLGINPFDQPNVAESKKNTSNLLEEWQKQQHFKPEEALLNADGFTIYGSQQAQQLPTGQVGEFIAAFESLAQQGDYIAFLPYFLMTDERRQLLQTWRMQSRDQLKVATTLLEGPRYLHSTGQLHKGGPDTGLYIIITEDFNKDLPIPDDTYGFGTLHQAQSLGDYRSLNDKGRRVIRINLGKDVDANLKKLLHLVSEVNTMSHA